VGAGLAMLIWIAGSIAFSVYVNQFSNYEKTYGSLAGVFIVLLWVYLTNLALLLGAEVDSEMERARELEAGIPAEEILQLPPRDTKVSVKHAAKLRDDIDRGRQLRRRSERARRDEARRRVNTSSVPRVGLWGRIVGAFVLVGAWFTGGRKRPSM
jgi:membrane protein